MNLLDIYKNSQIDELTTVLNQNLDKLRNQLISNIQKINALNIPKIIKLLRMKMLQRNYNNSVKKVIIEFNKQIDLILSINEIPKKSLLIGINYIGTENELYGCINDTNNCKDILQEKFSYNNFNILTDQTNKKPTKQNIINELTDFLVNSNKGDSLFFLYSGHGTYSVDFNKDELDGYDELIVPLDAININSCISDDELNNIIHNNLKEGVKLFMLFDSCFSGTVVDLKYNYLYDNDNIVNPNSLETKGDIFMISGCRDDQTSMDTVVNLNNKYINSGAMTFSFIKTINDLGTNITFKTLLENMRTILKENGYTQIPQLSSGKLIDINTEYISL